MKATPIEIGMLLQNRNRFCVPIYQRHYVWNKSKQWEPFWQDIRTKAIERLSDRKRRFSHFMGAVVLESRGKHTVKQVPSYQVVDGQQRLTTFQLFLTAARHYAIAIGHISASDNIRLFVLNSDENLMEEPSMEKFKVWPTEADRQMFKDIILSENREDLRNLYQEYWYKYRDKIYQYSTTPKLLGAYGYFYDNIKHSVETDDLLDDLEEVPKSGTDEFSSEENDILNPQKLDAIWESLLDDFKIVHIVLDEGDDAQVIFETLNDRGEPLLAADLVRNNIFQRADARGENAESLFANHWKPFEDDFWSYEEKQGRYRKKRIEFFLANFISGKIASEVTLSKLFSEYKAFIHSGNSGEQSTYPTVEAEIKNLAKFGLIYRELIERKFDTVLSTFSRRLQYWDVTTVYPLVLRLWESDELSLEDKSSALNTLLSYIVRRAVCGLTTKNYNRFFLSIVDYLDKTKWSLEQLNSFLVKQKAESSRFPNDEEFTQSLIQFPMYQRLGSARTRGFLIEIENSLRGPLQETNFIPNNVSIEHVMPVSWREHWPLETDTPLTGGDFLLASFWMEEDDTNVGKIVRRDRLIHSVGNLTLVTPPFNSKVSNKEFKVKKKALADQSVLILNRRIAKKAKWNEKKIEQRSNWISNLAKKVWSFPSISEADD